MAVPGRAWSIDDAVKDVYRIRVLPYGTEEEVLTTEALVHVGPFVDVLYSILNVLAAL